ncbi:N-acetyltransferase domain-containing protein [Candidatus Hydrogenisulfobacillus filiaventi]|uniref:N-acetyltransferase domain-containing protein n=1 Tax=Candidatus Hydrogenisulfobacillus filiaventi TaxID=2707344 RepID=A0A6F8ZEM7_9FIRM|nr:GNAT family N-acetyltransferase [Bacillota bacterium]CAB1128120.1 N-acetyltransferase domain-containing protein [Candidatus Hydrogenisulfobacillus filiaventi]
MAVEVRPYRAQDYRAVLDAQCDLYQINFPRFVCTSAFLGEQAQRIRTAVRRPYENGIFVLDDDGLFAGFIWVVIRMDLQGTFGSVDQVYLRPAYRRRGLGRLLLEAAHRFVAERGVRFARLYVTRDNQDAVHLYEREGYRIIRYEMERPVGPEDLRRLW